MGRKGKPTGQARDSACAQQIDPLNPAIGQAGDGDWPSIITARGRCGRAKAVEDSRGKDLHCSRFATSRTTHAAAKSRCEQARKRGIHLLRLRTLAHVWLCRIAVRVVRSTAGQRVAARWCLARTTSTTRMRDSTTAGPAESPYTGLVERYPLPALPTSWDGTHIHRLLPDIQQ